MLHSLHNQQRCGKRCHLFPQVSGWLHCSKSQSHTNHHPDRFQVKSGVNLRLIDTSTFRPVVMLTFYLKSVVHVRCVACMCEKKCRYAYLNGWPWRKWGSDLNVIGPPERDFSTIFKISYNCKCNIVCNPIPRSSHFVPYSPSGEPWRNASLYISTRVKNCPTAPIINYFAHQKIVAMVRSQLLIRDDNIYGLFGSNRKKARKHTHQSWASHVSQVTVQLFFFYFVVSCRWDALCCESMLRPNDTE